MYVAKYLLVPSIPCRACAGAGHVMTLAVVLARAVLCACVAVMGRLARFVARRSLPSGRACALARIRSALLRVVEVAETGGVAVLSPAAQWARCGKEHGL